MSFVVSELFGQAIGARKAAKDAREDSETETSIRQAWCPYMDARCDGGGNRDMMRVAANDPAIGPLFDKAVGDSTGGHIPCGVCSVERHSNGEQWAICPRRLLAFGPSGVSGYHEALAQRILKIGGFEAGQRVEVWSEIHLKETGPDHRKFDYRLDYVMRGVEKKSAPLIIEVMTCSTSGGNKAKGTDMNMAFRSAVLFARGIRPEPARSPGVNVRQVWARMASQLIVKSEAALHWGGRAVWVIQDVLAQYIQSQTALPLERLRSDDWAPGEVNLIVCGLDGGMKLYSGPIRSSKSARPCWLEILGAPHIPALESLARKLDESAPIGQFAI